VATGGQDVLVIVKLKIWRAGGGERKLVDYEVDAPEWVTLTVGEPTRFPRVPPPPALGRSAAPSLPPGKARLRRRLEMPSGRTTR
jgi:hypothetical protein